MLLIEDSRQQEGKHKNIASYCRKNGIQIVRQCLSVGDYMLTDGKTDENGKLIPSGKISVDTKTDCMELCKDVMSNDHRRFRAECIRAMEQGIQLIILVEEEVPYGMIEYWEVPRWENSNKFHQKGEPMTKIDPETFSKALATMTKKYGVKFRFCTRRQCPSRVIKYLKGEFK